MKTKCDEVEKKIRNGLWPPWIRYLFCCIVTDALLVPSATDPSNPAKWMPPTGDRDVFTKTAKTLADIGICKERVKNRLLGTHVCHPWRCLLACLFTLIVPFILGIIVITIARILARVSPTDCQCCSACQSLCAQSLIITDVGDKVSSTDRLNITIIYYLLS